MFSNRLPFPTPLPHSRNSSAVRFEWMLSCRGGTEFGAVTKWSHPRFASVLETKLASVPSKGPK
jgi:hypothetical protein